MPNVQISKYTRPGIFINEYDNSVITSPVATGGINTMVIGFSKQGQVNTAVLLTNTNDLTNKFGNIDRSLERKGSFFHRTITKMLSSGPVYALNLLATDDTLDQIQYQSLSAATSKSNGSTSKNSYRKFFNTTGFWKRDTNAFLSTIASDSDYNNVAFSLTNLSSQIASVFIFKSQINGFDVSLTSWYGSVDQVPSYLNQNDYASDYLVDVVIVAGDWSNYKTLSVDPRWSNYFDSTGLKISQIGNFTNDRNVNTLKYYQGLSLIPYFRDLSGKNIFIETIINADTDSTGIFCAYNIDLVETDFPTGMLDLIGNGLVNSEQSTIDFLSYKDTITETMSYGDVLLDTPGNVWSIISASHSSVLRSGSTSPHTRTANYSEGYISGVSATTTNTPTLITYNLTFTGSPYAIIGGSEVSISTIQSTFTSSTSNYSTTGATFTSTIVLHNTGVISKIDSSTPNINPIVNSTDLVLGYSTVYLGTGGSFSNFTYNNVYVNSTGYNDLVLNTDYTISATNSNIIITFLNTSASPVLSNYTQYRKIKYFNKITSLLSSAAIAEMTVLTNMTTQSKLSLSNTTISNIQTSTLVNKSFQLSGLGIYPDIVSGNLVFYTTDNEFVVGTTTMITTNALGTTSSGVVGRYSQFYLDYYNGDLNDNDYFYSNFVDPSDIENGGFNVTFTTYNNSPYIVLQTVSGNAANVWPGSGYVQSGDVLIFPTATINTGSVTISDYTNHASIFGGSASTGMYAFLLSQTGTYEYIPSVTNVYSVNLKHFLKLYIDTTGTLNAEFVDVNGDSQPLSSTYQGVGLINELVSAQYGFDVFSDRLNYKESVDVVYPSGYQSSPNKVLVDATRYANIIIGDFLEAYVDTSSLQVGEVPRNLTRILSKKFYAADTTKIEISCDSQIAVYNLGTSLNPIWQTTRYKDVEDYTTTYKAIVLSGFQMRQASMPDGTEARQTQILNLVASGTPLFNSLTNKNAIDFRYLVDSFGLGLIENSKQQLMDICGGRLDCFGFLNIPSMKYFASSQNPSFTTNGVLDTSLIAAGGNESLNPLFLYSFGTGQGTTCTGYFCPYLSISDNGRPLDLPPAMFVATTYMQKQNSNISSIVPWTVAAGVTNGKVTGFDNVETDFTPDDISNLNGAQMNPIVYKRNRGFVIETENTAQTLYKSSLSYIHVREVLIELKGCKYVVFNNGGQKLLTGNNSAAAGLEKVLTRYFYCKPVTA